MKFGFEMVEFEVPEWLFGGCIQEATGPRERIKLEKKKKNGIHQHILNNYGCSLNWCGNIHEKKKNED